MSAGAAAAAAAKRRREEEEEHMTPYSPRDLAEDWEFKILRSATGAFKNPTVLQRCLAEEGQAGWVLVEKFDNSRIRLKRPAAARQNDDQCAFDPYRTSVGMSEGRIAVLVVGGIVAGLAAGAALILLLTALLVKR
jgi:hypothetical protein